MKEILSGNEAIAIGALEAGTNFVSGYPGTPSTEVIETLQRLVGTKIYVERATNEKTAFEMALGASLGGAKAMATMKAPGALVAGDPIVSAAYSGTNGALVIYIADDPGPHTTQTEQDSRRFAKLAKLPMIEPADPQEARDYVIKAFEISRELKIPVILRSTTRVSHTVGVVDHGERKIEKFKPSWKREPERFVRAGMARNRERHRWVLERLRAFSKIINSLHHYEGPEKTDTLIVAVGVSYHYVKEALKKLNENVGVLKLASSWPIDPEYIIDLVKKLGAKRILVIEELDSFLEEVLKGIFSPSSHPEISDPTRLRYGDVPDVIIEGKNIVPQIGELNVDRVVEAIAKFLGKEVVSKKVREKPEIPSRVPPLCPGCPHRFSYVAIRKALQELKLRRSDVPIFGDIGCYALSVSKPIEGIDTEHCMGASISMAAGLKLSGYDKPVIATIGDSTLLHGGLPELIEAYHKRANITVVILDNSVIAMTGHQETPERDVTYSGRRTKPVRIEDIVKNLADHLRVVDPVNEFEKAIEVMKQALTSDGLNIVIMRAPCTIYAIRRKLIEPKPLRVDPEKCTGCKACILVTGCPALYRDEENKKAYIDEVFCVGCGLCQKVCPFDAIVE